MTGKIAFEAFENIDPKFILEAAPDAGIQSAAGRGTDGSTKKGKRPPFHSGWVAAAMCAVVALGVYLGALWMGQGEWESPAVTAEGTETTEAVVTDIDETADETVTEPEPEPEPEPYVFANSHFIAEKIGNQYYLNLWRGNSRHLQGLVPWLEFDSMDTMFNALYYGELTETQIQYIASMRLDTSSGYMMADLWNMAEPVIPEGGQLKQINWYCSEYEFHYTHPDVSAGITLRINDRTETDGWAQREADRKSKDGYPKTDVTVDGISAIATTRVTETDTYINLYLAIEDEATDREIYFYAKYQTTADADPQDVVSTTAPCQLTLVGLQGNKRFSDQIFDGTLPVLNREFFLSFAVKPYTPPVSEPPSELSADEPYVMEIIDGIHYLTFPEWDDSRIDISLPEGRSLRSPVYKTVTELTEKINAQELSHYEIEIFKLMADDNGRVRLPNSETYLAPSIPDYVPQSLGYTFSKNGSWDSILEYSDCTGQYDCYFSVISEDEWKTLREKEFLVEKADGLNILQVVEGTFDGLPCTFYEYSRDPSSKEGEYVLCHVRLTEDAHAREYFFRVYGNLYDLGIDQHETNAYPEYMEYDFGRNAAIFGVINGQYYYFSIAEIQKLTADVLRQFAVTPVTP